MRNFGYAPMHLVSTPDGPLALAVSGLHENPGMLIPLDGKAGRVLRGEGTDFFRYVTNGEEQTALIVALGGVPCPTGLYALDPATLESRWRLGAPFDQIPIAPDMPPWLWGLESSGVLAFFSFNRARSSSAPDSPAELTAVDARTGRQRFRRHIPPFAHPLAFTESLLLAAEDGKVSSLARDDGRALFEVKFADWPPLGADLKGDYVGLVVPRSQASSPDQPERCVGAKCSLDLLVARSSDGIVLHRIPLGPVDEPRVANVEVDGETVYVEAPRILSGSRAARIEAYAAEDGRRLWATPETPCGNSQIGLGSLHATATELLACGCDGVLRALDRRDGRVKFEFGVGGCARILRSTRAVVFAMPAPGFGIGVIRPDALPPPEHVTVTGAVRADANVKLRFPRRVRVGPKLADTDAHGNFRVPLEGRGMYSVELELTDADPSLIVEELAIALEPGKTMYAAEVHVRTAAY
jgi:hypothetical protein